LPEQKHNESFEELYNLAASKAITIIRQVNKVLYENKPIEDILKYIPNLDYSSGIIIKETKQLRHFEY
jgi:hypothetical protein